MPKTWIIYGAKNASKRTPNGDEYFHHFYPTPRLVRFCGTPTEQVLAITLREDEKGEYLGWLRTGEEVPSLIQLAYVFPIQFTNGVQEEINKGKGQVVKLAVASYTIHKEEK